MNEGDEGSPSIMVKPFFFVGVAGSVCGDCDSRQHANEGEEGLLLLLFFMTLKPIVE